jgi:hypothetical protein
VRHIELASALGATAKIHFLDVPLDILRVRLERRNAELPPYNFHIDPATLRGFVGLFERPSQDEGATLVVVRDSSQESADRSDAH